MRNKHEITKLNVLITGCFAPGTPGTILGLQLMGIENLEIYGTDTNLVTNVIPNFNAVYQVNTSEAKYIDDVLKIVKKHKIDVILPQTNYETLALSKNISLFDGLCKIALAGDYSTIRFANDKFEVMNAAIKLGIPSSRFVNFFEQKELLSLIETIEKENQSFYFKGRSESGGRGIVKVLPNNEFLGNLLKKPESIHAITMSVFKEQIMTNPNIFQDFFVMEEFEGDEYTVDVFKSENNFLAIPRKRLKIRSGVSQINRIEKNESLIYASKVIAESLGLTGLFGFQFIYKDENSFTILECNPRIQGTNFASILAGSNLIEYLVLSLFDREFNVLEPDWNKIFIRTSGGILIET
jgi:carbamoyl-phosphate synthase large subunit